MFLAYPKSRAHFGAKFRIDLLGRVSFWLSGMRPQFLHVDHWKLNLGGGDVLQSVMDVSDEAAPPPPPDGGGGATAAASGTGGGPATSTGMWSGLNMLSVEKELVEDRAVHMSREVGFVNKQLGGRRGQRVEVWGDIASSVPRTLHPSVTLTT